MQRKFIWRARKIHEFVNDCGYSLQKAFEQGDIDDFRIYDPAGENWRRELDEQENAAFEAFIGIGDLSRNPSIFVVYCALGLFSVFLVILPWVVVLVV